MSLAIVKPDHIGDLVLSSPAIRSMAAAAPGAVLFAAPKCVPLANILFPGMEVRPLALPHLGKSRASESGEADLTGFDRVVFLRRDGVIDERWASLRTRDWVLPNDTHDDHQSVIDYGCALEVCGDYDIDAAFHSDGVAAARSRALRPVRKVGLSIGSGFHANAWPALRWIELARALRRQDLDVVVLAGEAERAQAQTLVEAVGLGASALRIGAGFGTFLDQLDDVDLVVASDGGTAHLCSLRVRVVSLFGASPLFRYAPFGAWNRAISLRLPCSPCCQYATDIVNGCLSVECMAGLGCDDALAAMRPPVEPDPFPREVRLAHGRRLYLGLSHLRREAKLAERRLDWARWRA